MYPEVDLIHDISLMFVKKMTLSMESLSGITRGCPNPWYISHVCAEDDLIHGVSLRCDQRLT